MSARGVGRGDDLDVEAVEQCARTELRVGDTGGDLVIYGVGSLGARNQVDPEHLDELVFQPVSRGRAAEKPPVLTEGAPDPPRIGLDRTSMEPRHPQPS